MSNVAQKQVPKGYRQTEVGVVPNEWVVSTVGDEFEVKLGKMLDAEKNTGIQKPYLGNKSVQWGGVNSENLQSMQMSQEDMKRFRLEVGDLLVCEGGEVGRAAIWNGVIDECYYQKALHRLRSKRGFNPGLMLAYLRFWTDHSLIDNYVSQTSIAHLTREKFVSIPMPIPPEEEQTAIANALSDVDALITSLEKLIAKKRAIKTAAMQQLLTGKTRLPPFDENQAPYKQTELGEIPEDWEVDDIGRVLSITTGDKNTQDNVGDGQYPFFVRSQTVERINSYSFDGEAVLTAGDGVGTGKIYHYIKGKFDYHQRVYLMHNFCDRLDGYYFYIYFSNNFYARIMSMTAKSSVDSVRREMIADMKIVLPPIEEQVEISKTLTDMDKEIEVLGERLNKTQQLKQGMMQELLTGRKRLV